jgi:NADPH:quinone reductase-like Zn-dependent oxidoreductase
VAERVPAGNHGLRVGDRVFGMARTHGSYAEYTAVALQTIDLLEVSAGQRVVVMGATGGIGGYTVQIARSRGAHVIGTVRGDDGEARRVGADEGWFAKRQITAHNHSSSANPLISPEGLTAVGQLLANGTITARIDSTVDLAAAGQVLEELRQGGLRGKAIIRL